MASLYYWMGFHVLKGLDSNFQANDLILNMFYLKDIFDRSYWVALGGSITAGLYCKQE